MAVDAITEMETETPVDVAMETRAETAVEITNSHEATPDLVLTPTEKIQTAGEAIEARVEMAVRVATVVEAVLARSLRRVLMCVLDFLRAYSPHVWGVVPEGVQKKSNKYQNHLNKELKSNLFLALFNILYLFACISFCIIIHNS